MVSGGQGKAGGLKEQESHPRSSQSPGQSRLPLRPRGPHRSTSTLVHPGSDCRHRFLAKRPHVKVLASRLDAPSRPCCLLALQFSKCGRCHEPRENSEAPPAGATRRRHHGFPLAAGTPPPRPPASLRGAGRAEWDSPRSPSGRAGDGGRGRRVAAPDNSKHILCDGFSAKMSPVLPIRAPEPSTSSCGGDLSITGHQNNDRSGTPPHTAGTAGNNRSPKPENN
ncbi:uncharacterized protein LOC122681573 [Cervus elaphus]|uniref:uncharacterized protein LOC122681573 n=1 Tax=Cervus elaphus TaxID=9860 RepID=UPI001CC31ECD|nr:uncharacterized protein LOC122681573 [Cervus elaphus]